MFDQTMAGKPTLLSQADDAHGRTITFAILVTRIAVATSNPGENQNLLTTLHIRNIATDSLDDPW